jgi:hypothetical protein
MTRPAPPSARGLVPLWRSGDRCPGCGGQNWWVGRVMAQCGRCDTALVKAEREMAA